jgi:hypothetical protein
MKEKRIRWLMSVTFEVEGDSPELALDATKRALQDFPGQSHRCPCTSTYPSFSTLFSHLELAPTAATSSQSELRMSSPGLANQVDST